MTATPVVLKRTVNDKVKQKAIQEGLDPVIANIIAGRNVPSNCDIKQYLQPKLGSLENPNLMQDMDKAALRIVKAILTKETIALETDHDCDGQTSNAVLYHNLVYRFRHPKEKLKVYIGHRLNEGYGLSDKVAARILADKPSLVITADNGSSDEDRIALLKENQIDVIVTDHHQIPVEGIPKSAYAVVNPTREDSDYKDDCIAGCMVAWLLMTVVRTKLIQIGYLKKENESLRDSLDFVAVGTIADCVSMAKSLNNRAVVRFGLSIINQGLRPCWRAIKAKLKREITAEDLGFVVGPLLNSDGRLATALRSVSFLLAEDDMDAKNWLQILEEQNQQRKEVQKTLVEKGIQIAEQEIKKGRTALCIYLEDGHSGVHGIAASRIKDRYGRPTIFLTPKVTDENLITGSARSIDDFHIQKALQQVHDVDNTIMVGFGGHKGAAGLTLPRQNLDKFIETFDFICSQLLHKNRLCPKLFVDSELFAPQLNFDFFEQLQMLEPFGREFDAPVFEIQGMITDFRLLSDGQHLKLDMMVDDTLVTGIWFNHQVEVEVGDIVRAVVSLKENNFNNQRKLELQIYYLFNQS